MHIERAPEVMFQDLGNESILLDMGGGTYFGLDAVGTRFWQALVAGKDLDGAVAVLLETFDVDEASLRADLLRLVAELKEEGLVKESDTMP